MHLYEKSKELIAGGTALADVLGTGLFEKVSKMKYDIPNDKPELFLQRHIGIIFVIRCV